MSRLFLLRHAKAAWAQPGMRDFDRPLQAVGRSDAEALGAEMAARGHAPERVLCSTALRARQTWAAVADPLGVGVETAVFEDRLYSSDATGYLTLIQESADAETVLVVGHNPMMEDLAAALAGDGEASMLAAGFPTCGLAVMRFSDSLREAAPGKGVLEAFLKPGAR